MMPTSGNIERQPRLTMQQVRFQRRQRLVTRMAILFGISLLMLVCAVAGATWMYRYFYRDNPHFVFRELELNETVHFKRKNVQELLEGLDGCACVVGKSSLLNLDIAAVRAAIMANPLVKNANVMRVMPGTLKIDILERRAVAFVSGGQTVGALADEDGVLFPYTGSEGLDLPMPYITGVAGLQDRPWGRALEDSEYAGAIWLVNETETRSKIDGAGYSVYVIRLNPQRERLEVNLKPLYGNRVFPSDGATVWLPSDREKMAEALARLDAILVRKVSDSETLSFADVTLQYNVPTRD